MKTHLIFDLETIGTNTSKCPVVDMAYTLFDWDVFTTNDPYTFDDLLETTSRIKFGLGHQVNEMGYKFSKTDLGFWEEQPYETRSLIYPAKEDLFVKEGMALFLNNIIEHGRINYWWARGPHFDVPILDRLMRDAGMYEDYQRILPFWNCRDVRTFIDAKFNFSNKRNGFIPMKDEDKWNSMFNAHNSTHDIVADVLRMQVIVRAENDLDFE